MAIIIGLPIGLLASALAQAPSQSDPDPAVELIGAPVFARDGSEVGEVSAVSVGEDGQISEVRVTTALPLGFGPRTVVIPHGSFMALRGAVMLDLSPDEFQALPSPALRQGTTGPRSPKDWR